MQSKVISDVIVDSAMANALGYASDTVYSLYIPNTFTPNGDGINDLFAPDGTGDWKSYYFEIRDKYNKRIFNTVDRFKGWDGKAAYEVLQQGVYQYYVEIKTGIPDMVHKYTGGVMIVK
ncbi:MAG: gliding motility-associated C-terminal domain-containing protein [Bacteroidia bacterium]|nr:gliding motility-associated C-terminal domain-containing protein [Bacteroidia bacterium]